MSKPDRYRRNARRCFSRPGASALHRRRWLYWLGQLGAVALAGCSTVRHPSFQDDLTTAIVILDR